MSGRLPGFYPGEMVVVLDFAAGWKWEPTPCREDVKNSLQGAFPASRLSAASLARAGRWCGQPLRPQLSVSLRALCPWGAARALSFVRLSHTGNPRSEAVAHSGGPRHRASPPGRPLTRPSAGFVICRLTLPAGSFWSFSTQSYYLLIHYQSTAQLCLMAVPEMETGASEQQA